jgi:hypothetical protein
LPDLKDHIEKDGTLLHHLTSMSSHLVVIVVSAGIAFSLPWAARHFLTFWSHVEHEQMLLMSVEVAVAALLILLVNLVRRSIKDRRLANIAVDAGLVSCFQSQGKGVRHQVAVNKSQQGLGRQLRVIGFTGFSTFADPKSDLYPVVQSCLEARILLANPLDDRLRRNIECLPDSVVTWEQVQREVMTSIALLKRLKAAGKRVRLKLYSDPPLVRLAILGEHVWLQCYHTDFEVGTRPLYVFQHDRQEHGLYALWYQYFLKRWTDQTLPEYDLDRDELVYREESDGELKREMLDPGLATIASQLDPAGISLTSQTVDIASV